MYSTVLAPMETVNSWNPLKYSWGNRLYPPELNSRRYCARRADAED